MHKLKKNNKKLHDLSNIRLFNQFHASICTYASMFVYMPTNVHAHLWKKFIVKVWTTDLKLTIPIPNRSNFEIESEDENVVEIDGMNLAYQKNVLLRKSKISKHYISHNSFNFIFKNVTSVLDLDDETKVLRSAFAKSMENLWRWKNQFDWRLYNV